MLLDASKEVLLLIVGVVAQLQFIMGSVNNAVSSDASDNCVPDIFI